jgi:hypothetical protein
MHELSTCTVLGDGGVLITGFVRAFVDDVLKLGTKGIAQKTLLGNDVTVRLLDEVRGECTYVGFVTKVGLDNLDVEGVELLEIRQRRAVTRVGVSIPLTGHVLPFDPTERDAPPEDAEPEIEPATLTEPDDGDHPAPHLGGPLSFTLVDISAHGMRIRTKHALLRGSVIRFRFEELKHPFTIDAVVLRTQESRTGTFHGCQFTSLTSREEDALFRYVLQTQGEQRRERMNA